MIKKQLRQKTLSSKENYNHLFQRFQANTYRFEVVSVASRKI